MPRGNQSKPSQSILAGIFQVIFIINSPVSPPLSAAVERGENHLDLFAIPPRPSPYVPLLAIRPWPSPVFHASNLQADIPRGPASPPPCLPSERGGEGLVLPLKLKLGRKTTFEPPPPPPLNDPAAHFRPPRNQELARRVFH